jgi:hypothetical protein
MPVIEKTNLLLLGLSAGDYIGLKSTENKSPQPDDVGQNSPK